METAEVPITINYNQEIKQHPLSKNWVNDNQPTFRHDINSKGFKRQIEGWFHTVESTAKVLKLDNCDETFTDYSDINNFLTSTGQIPVFAQLYEIEDSVLNSWFMEKTDRNMLKYIKELSKQLFRLYQHVLTKDNLQINERRVLNSSPCESIHSRQLRPKTFRKLSTSSYNLGYRFNSDTNLAYSPNPASTLRSWNFDYIKPTSNYDTSPNSSDFEEVPKLLRRTRSKSIPSKRNQPQHSHSSFESTTLLWKSNNKSPKTSLRSKSSWATNLADNVNNKKKQSTVNGLEFNSDLELDNDSVMEIRSEYELQLATQPVIEPAKELMSDIFSDSTLPLAEDYTLSMSPTEDLADSSFYREEIVELIELPKKSNRNYSRRGSSAGYFPPYPSIDFMILTEISSPPATCTSPTIGVSNLTTLKYSPSLESTQQPTLPMATTLLTKIIDSQNDNTVLSVEERWSNFIQLHAPLVESDELTNTDTQLLSHLPHPLAPVSNLDFEQVDCSVECQLNRTGELRTRHPINLSKMSSSELRELRRLCRTGIPDSFRPTIWFQGSGASALAETNYYRGLLTNPCPTYLRAIEMDLPRTIPAHPYFSQSQGNGLIKLRNVLIAYATHNPTVGYCQGMNLIAANLLIVLNDEEHVFFTLVHLVETILPPNYYDLKLTDARIDQLVLNQLVAKHLPQLHQHLTDLNVDFTAVTFNWFLSLFCDNTTAPLKLRVWDCLLIEGTPTLFWFSLAILNFHQPSLLNCQCPYQLYTALGKLTNCLNTNQVKDLARKAFTTYRPKINLKEVNKLRAHFNSL